ncbi:hypothetical protein FACS1894122_04390 [Alphaproteobacteria bacterium]|nr:hypothetical protein FACS1894122_04390 [Alphaproteobacteria bacterium]
MKMFYELCALCMICMFVASGGAQASITAGTTCNTGEVNDGTIAITDPTFSDEYFFDLEPDDIEKHLQTLKLDDINALSYEQIRSLGIAQTMFVFHRSPITQAQASILPPSNLKYSFSICRDVVKRNGQEGKKISGWLEFELKDLVSKLKPEQIAMLTKVQIWLLFSPERIANLTEEAALSLFERFEELKIANEQRDALISRIAYFLRERSILPDFLGENSTLPIARLRLGQYVALTTNTDLLDALFPKDKKRKKQGQKQMAALNKRKNEIFASIAQTAQPPACTFDAGAITDPKFIDEYFMNFGTDRIFRRLT